MHNASPEIWHVSIRFMEKICKRVIIIMNLFQFKHDDKYYVIDAEEEPATEAFGRLINHSKTCANVKPKPLTRAGKVCYFPSVYTGLIPA